MPLNDLPHALLWHLRRMPERAVERGVSPAWLGWRWRVREPLESYLERRGSRGDRQVLHPPRTALAPLPRNVAARAGLSDDGALWDYAMRDVPERSVAATYLARIGPARLLFFHTAGKGDFFPALISDEETSLESREIAHRPGHAAQAAATARGEIAVQHFDSAAWILERAYHNHSHWLTAHLPKLLILKERGLLGEVLMPRTMTGVMEASMRMLGIDPATFRRFDPERPVAAEDLTLLVTDRFDPAHMQAVRSAFADPARHGAAVSRRVFISRERSRGRRITNETALWAMLEPRGFEKVFMEDLAFPDQVALMQQTRVLLAPHGAGLTNMLFCLEGGHVVELADPGFPNPNFYNLASGLGLHYWLLHAEAGTAEHPLDRDLTVDVAGVEAVLDAIG